MATEYLFSNNATTTLAQSVSATATVLNVASGTGSLFPSPASGQAFAVTLVDAATGLTNEICYCTSRSGDQLTVIRGREGTNATTWQAGDTCANYITADVMESWLQESDLNGYLTQTTGDGRYVKKSGDTSTGTQYSTGWFWGGYGAGWGGSTTSGQLRWTVYGVAFGNPDGDASPKYSGNLCVTDVLNDGGNNESGINMRGYDSEGTLYNWFYAWNGNITTPKGLVAFQSDLSGYVANTNPGIANAQAGTSLCVNPSDGRAYFAYNSNTKIGTLAWYADVTAETAARVNADNNLQTQVDAKQPAGNYVTGSQSGIVVDVVEATVTGTEDISFGKTYSQVLFVTPQNGTDGKGTGMTNVNSWTTSTANVSVASYHTGAPQEATITQAFLVIAIP